MTELIDELEVGRWIKTRAEAATGLKAYLDLIPEAAPLPAIRFSFQMRHDVYTVEMHAPFTRYMATVLVVADMEVTPVATLRGHAVSLDASLHRAAGDVGQARILTCVRDGSFGLTETEGAHTYRHAGATWIIQAAPVS